MSITRTTILQRIVQELGGYYGTITSGSATTAVLAGLAYISTDANEFVDWKLMMPDAATAADQERQITSWAATTGTATFATRADTTYTSENFLLLPPKSYTLAQLRNAINDVMRQSKQSLKTIIPTANQRREYPLTALSWLRGAGDVDGLAYRNSNNMVDNEGFGKWQAATNPDGWTIAGSGGTATRVTTSQLDGYAAQVASASANVTLTYTVDASLAQQMAAIDGAPAKVEFGGWARTSSASKVRIGCSDGVTTTYTSYHTGGGSLEWLNTTKTIAATTTTLQLILSVETGTITAQFARAALCEGSILQQIRDYGSEAFSPQPLTADVQMVGGVPTVILPGPMQRGQQIIVTSRRPFTEFSADSDSTDLSEEIIYHGALYQLTSIRRQGEDRTRLDEIAKTHGAAYRSLAKLPIDLPLRKTRAAFVTIGA